MKFLKKYMVKIMLWVEIVKVLLKAGKQIQKDLKEEKSASDDSPNRITPDEYAITITENLIEVVPELVRIFQKRVK
jgi:hypothetical protein